MIIFTITNMAINKIWLENFLLTDAFLKTFQIIKQVKQIYKKEFRALIFDLKEKIYIVKLAITVNSHANINFF